MKLRSEAGDGTSGHFVQKSHGKLRQESAQSRPSDRRYEKAGRRVERTGAKLDKARVKLDKKLHPPKRRGLMRVAAGTAKLVTRPAKAAVGASKHELWRYSHGKIREVEQENVGVEAAHRAELTGEAVVRGTSRFVKKRIRTRPARMVKKWETKNIRARADQELQKQIREHPELKTNYISRQWQKKRLQRQYQKQAREAAKKSARAAKQTAKASKEAARATKRVLQAVLLSVKTHPVIYLSIAGAFLLFATLQACMGSAMALGNGILGGISGTASAAGDTGISSAMSLYSEWETDLLLEAKSAEDDYPGYDDYVFDLDPVGTGTDGLLALLIVKTEGGAAPDLEAMLREVFDLQYNLTITKTKSGGDRVLEVELITVPFSEVMEDYLSAEEFATWESLMEMMQSGNLVGSPFPFDWTPYMTDGYGWRVHPITGEKDFHGAQDIAVLAGTEILAGGKGTVLEAKTHSLYGFYVLIDYGGNICARYSHCSKLLVSAGDKVQIGDAIALVGSTGASTGNHLDLEIILNGERVNPMYFVAIPYETTGDE